MSTVEQESGARQIAGVLEQQDEEEQNDDLRQEHQDAADARQHAVDQQILEQAVRQAASIQPTAECVDTPS